MAPLDNTQVYITITSPTGVITTAYSGAFNQGTHSIPMSSAESGVHRVMVYIDGVLLEEMQLTFE